MTDKERRKLEIISAYIGSPLTEEQMEFASNFNRNVISFSDPGTGKTHTLVAGLVMAQSHHQVQGNKINCMSFTKAAASEIAGRYENLCRVKLGITPTVVFNTFHALSRQILVDAYGRIGIRESAITKDDIELMKSYMDDTNLDTSDSKYIRKVIKAINTLNSSLTFHPDNVSRRYDFVELNIDIADFQNLRKRWFVRNLINKEITKGDIPLYCLYALMSKSELIEKWKSKYDIMVVDEFQDLSLLHLHILSYIANKLVVVGDMKQQIYVFNGACPQIVREYMKLKPDAVICNLTNSFRCGQEISDFATSIIKPNDESIVPFKGHNRGSTITLIPRREIDWESIADTIQTDIALHGRANARNVMFLYRNNASAIPIIDELYKREIPYRCPKFDMVMDTPVLSSLCKLANVAWQPDDINFTIDAVKLFPEFKNIAWGTEAPVVSAIRQSGSTLLDIKYKFRESSSIMIINAIKDAREAILAKKSAGVVCMKLMKVYEKFIYPTEWWTFSNNAEFYLSLVAPVANFKTYPQMYNEELDKVTKNRQAIQAGMGIRCYTMHSAKGLEADDVYILDCDEGTFPNAKIMEEKLKAGCEFDVATDIMAERNLLYVAITRAKENVIISYSGASPTKLLSNPDSPEYTMYDEIYKRDDIDFNDAEEFIKLFRLGGDDSNG